MRNNFCFLVGILILSSCRPSLNRLAEIEPLIQTHPDSALVILQEWDRLSLRTGQEKAFHALLYSMALDKCYIDVTEDTLTRVALDYYKKGRDRNHRMKAFYYDGLVQKNRGNTLGALIDLERAYQVAERLQDYHYEGLITKNLSMLHYEEWDYDLSRDYCEQSYQAFQHAGEELYAQYSLLGLARCCQNTKQYSVSDSLHREVILKPDQNPNLKKNAYRSLAALKMDQEVPDAQEALDAMNGYQQAGGRMYTEPSVTKARAFVLAGQMDSARYYLDIARDAAVTAVDSASYYYGNYEYLAAGKAFESADKDLRKCFAIEDSLTVLRLKRSVMHAQKDSYRREADYQHDLATKRLIILILIFCLSVLSGIIAVEYYRKKKREFVQELDRFQAAEGELKEQITLLTEHDERQKAGLISMIVGRISVITMLGREYSALQEAPSRESSYDHFDRMKKVDRKSVV